MTTTGGPETLPGVHVSQKTLDELQLFGIGEAVRLLEENRLVARAGWNGRGMYLVLLLPGTAAYQSPDGARHPFQPCIGMKTADGNMQPGWLASQADLLAKDWFLVST